MFDADAGKTSAVIHAASALGFDGVEWVVPGDAGALAESLRVLAADLPESAGRRCSVATRVEGTNLEEVVHVLNEALVVCGRLRAACISVTLPPIARCSV